MSARDRKSSLQSSASSSAQSTKRHTLDEVPGSTPILVAQVCKQMKHAASYTAVIRYSSHRASVSP